MQSKKMDFFLWIKTGFLDNSKRNLLEDSISAIKIREQFFKVISLKAKNYLHV